MRTKQGELPDALGEAYWRPGCQCRVRLRHHGKVRAKILLPYHRELNLLHSSLVIKEQISLPVVREGSLKSPFAHHVLPRTRPLQPRRRAAFQTAPEFKQVHAGPGEGSALKEEPHSADVEIGGDG
jgi:hypothetical protein